MSHRRFVITVSSLAAAAFAVLASINFCVNPYAQYPTDWFEPMVQTMRAEKVEMLKRRQTAPEGLIVGSSRVLKFEPDFAEQVMGQGFLNAGVNHGKPEDYLAMLRLYRKRFGCMPKTLVVGLDVSAFNESLPVDARLLNHSELARQIPDVIPLADRFHRVRELLSWQQTMASARSVKRSLSGSESEPEIQSCREDGLIVYHQREAEIGQGTYDFDSAMAYTKREYKHLFVGYDRLSSARLEWFWETVGMCQAEGTRVIVLLTPLHPDLYEYLADGTTFLDRYQELRQLLEREGSERGFEFVDFTDIRAFGGEKERFVDGVHPLEANTRRMICRLFGDDSKEVHRALQ